MSEKTVKVINQGAPFGGVYFFAAVGAAVYFIQNTSGFWNVIWAIIKGLFWPGFLVHRAFELMGM